MAKLIYVLLIVWSLGAQAYIPSGDFVLERTAKNHGQGAYLLKQEVMLRQGQENIVIQETWLIEGDSYWSMMAQGPGIKVFLHYRNGSRIYVDESGQKKSSSLPKEFFEPYFWIRSKAGLIQQAVADGFAPPALRKKNAPTHIKDVEYKKEPFMRLGRVGGGIVYQIGMTRPGTDLAGPVLFVEQDKFVIRKIKWSEGVEISADEYGEYGRNLAFPKARTVVADGFFAALNVTRLDGLSEDHKVRLNFSLDTPQAIKAAIPSWGATPATAALVKGFYSRFR